MKATNLFKTGVGLVALAIAGACASGQNIEVKPEQKPKAKVENLDGRTLDSANARPFSELPVQTQVEYFFKIPVRQNKLGDLTGFRSTDNEYTVVYCSKIGNLDIAMNFNMPYAQNELARQLGIRKGILDNTKVNRTRRVGNYFCGSYSVDRKNVRRK